MKQFQLGEYLIDVDRCQISSANYQVDVEPKVMEVLVFMHSRAGEVVGQQEIFEQVWPGSIFNSNSVQRCITLLRQALREDAKNARLIATHSRRGYSLESPKSIGSTRNNFMWSSLLIITILIALSVWYSLAKNPIKESFSRLVPISSSEQNESFLSVSPDGKYLAFVRGEDEEKSIWVRALNSSEEIRITKQVTNYNVLGWSPNGTALVYMYLDQTTRKRVMAYSLLDMIAFKPLEQTIIHSFPDTYVNGRQLQWGSDNKVYFVEWDKESGETWLSYLDFVKGKYRLVPSKGQDWLITFALSPNSEKIALSYVSGQNQHRVDLYDLKTGKVDSLATLPRFITGISWHPEGSHVLVSNRTELQLIDMKGEISTIKFKNYKAIRDAQFSSSGGEIFMELDEVDIDIIQKLKSEPQTVETLIDTSSVDTSPVFSPVDSRFVFESRRTGKKQLYLYNSGSQKLIFANPENEDLFGVVWSPDGSRIITAHKSKLFVIDPLTTEFKELKHNLAPFHLQAHFKHGNAVLVSLLSDEGGWLHPAKLNLENLDLTVFSQAGKRMTCYSMALDDQDTVYFSRDNAVFKVNQHGRQEKIWLSKEHHISEMSIKGDYITAMLRKGKQLQMTRIGIESGFSEIIFKELADGSQYEGISHNEEMFLYLSKPQIKSQLVQLK